MYDKKTTNQEANNDASTQAHSVIVSLTPVTTVRNSNIGTTTSYGERTLKVDQVNLSKRSTHDSGASDHVSKKKKEEISLDRAPSCA